MNYKKSTNIDESKKSQINSKWLNEFNIQVNDSLNSLQDGSDWKERVETLKNLDDMFLSSLLDKQEVIIAVEKIELLVPGLIRQLSDVRSSIVKVACTTISSMGKATGKHFNPIATKLIPTLLSLTNVTIGVVSQSGIDCIEALVKYSRFDYCLLFNALKAKNEARRLCAIQSINSVLKNWSKDEIDSDFDGFFQAIKLAVTDAHSKTREQGRFGLNLMTKVWSDHISIIADMMDSERSVRNTFIREYPESALSKEFMPIKSNTSKVENRPLSLSEHKEMIRRQQSMSPPRKSSSLPVEIITNVSHNTKENKGNNRQQSKLRKPTNIEYSSPKEIPIKELTNSVPIQTIRKDNRLDELLKWRKKNYNLQTKRTSRKVLMESPTMKAALESIENKVENNQQNDSNTVNVTLNDKLNNNLQVDKNDDIKTSIKHSPEIISPSIKNIKSSPSAIIIDDRVACGAGECNFDFLMDSKITIDKQKKISKKQKRLILFSPLFFSISFIMILLSATYHDKIFDNLNTTNLHKTQINEIFSSRLNDQENTIIENNEKNIKQNENNNDFNDDIILKEKKQKKQDIINHDGNDNIIKEKVRNDENLIYIENNNIDEKIIDNGMDDRITSGVNKKIDNKIDIEINDKLNNKMNHEMMNKMDDDYVIIKDNNNISNLSTNESNSSNDNNNVEINPKTIQQPLKNIIDTNGITYFFTSIFLLSAILISFYYYSISQYNSANEDNLDNSIEIYYDQISFDEWIKKKHPWRTELGLYEEVKQTTSSNCNKIKLRRSKRLNKKYEYN